MKTIITLCFLMLIISASAQRSVRSVQLLANVDFLIGFSDPESAIKGQIMLEELTKRSNSNQSRLKTTRRDDYVSDTWQSTDSTIHQYTGSNGYADYWWGLWLWDQSSDYDFISGAWQNAVRKTQLINANSDVTEYITETWNGTSWRYYFRSVIQWDDMHQYVNILDFYWNVGSMSWDTTSQDLYTYNANDLVTEILTQTWKVNTWENDGRSTYTYNASGLVTEFFIDDWNGNAWQGYLKNYYTYDADNRLIGHIRLDMTNPGVHDDKIEYTYDANGNLNTLTIYFIYLGNWENSSQNIYSYDANNWLTIQRNYKWYYGQSTTWENFLETTYTYDISGNATNIYQEKWNTASTQWENFTMNDYTFNSYNQVTSQTNSDWLAGTWEYDFRNIYTYELYDDLVSGIETQAVTDIAVYPNPAGEWTIISFQLADKNKAELKVLDFTGKEIFSAFIEDQYTLQTAHWSSGVYLMKIKTDKGELVKKLVKN